jgi:hypothetical protein
MKTQKYITLTLALLGTAGAAWAQSSGTLTIQGTVAAVNTIAVAPQSGYNTLNISGGVSGQNVANITETSNDRNGYTVTMTSLNAGASGSSLFLAEPGPGTNTVPYSLTYNSVAVSFSSGSATLTSATSRTALAGVVKALAITIAASWVDAATYSDTLTFTIAGK